MTRKYDDSEFLDAFRNTEMFLTTDAIADRVGCDIKTANRRLRELSHEDEVEFIPRYPTHLESTPARPLMVQQLQEEDDRMVPEEYKR